ncbi:MAG: selenide, water dikinase SelD [Deltaproteobacteria bacterium]|nr:selenide, water dikinase SelD [Deltaproteobacteria bacterium]
MGAQVIKLTQTVNKGGCAAKIAAIELNEIINKLKFPKKQGRLIINGEQFDDAAVYKISKKLYLIKTLDFFTPIVDDPYLFGQVAAANAMSDVYAMGGRPVLALAILAYPSSVFEKQIIAKVLQGAIDNLKKANADLAGGHSIDDETIKFGLSVTGFTDNNTLWANNGALAGDKLILTKALGTGTLMAGLKFKTLSKVKLEEAYTSMRKLNNIIDIITKKEKKAIHAATDITGFGLAGHSYQMAKASRVSFKIKMSSVPVFEHVIASLKMGNLTKAHKTNADYTNKGVVIDGSLNKEERLICFDPQTSGGLLLAVDPDYCEGIIKKIKREFKMARVIGEVNPRGKQDVYFCR